MIETSFGQAYRRYRNAFMELEQSVERMAAMFPDVPKPLDDVRRLTLSGKQMNALVGALVSTMTTYERLGIDVSIEQELLPRLLKMQVPQASKELVELTIK